VCASAWLQREQRQRKQQTARHVYFFLEPLPEFPLLKKDLLLLLLLLGFFSSSRSVPFGEFFCPPEVKNA
jgi:hypothetical protein